MSNNAVLISTCDLLLAQSCMLEHAPLWQKEVCLRTMFTGFPVSLVTMLCLLYNLYCDEHTIVFNNVLNELVRHLDCHLVCTCESMHCTQKRLYCTFPCSTLLVDHLEGILLLFLILQLMLSFLENQCGLLCQNFGSSVAAAP